jgi:sulfopyruvate decarboxylase alpha subunit
VAIKQEQRTSMASARRDVSNRIADELGECGIGLVASLPDDWVADLIKVIELDDRFIHVPVNREESAVGLCSGTFFSKTYSAALMGASGMLTCIYAITKINYTYEIPMFFLVSMRGAVGDTAKYQISNGIYFLDVLDTIDLPYKIIERSDQLSEIPRVHRHSRVYSRPSAIILSRELLHGET